jgi:lysophospholipid acyltransferase (LPLAT)-like uncharacterized protein
MSAASQVNSRLHRTYAFRDLSDYSFKDRLLIRAAGLVFFTVIKLVGLTIRFEVEGWENWEAATRDAQVPIYTTWHNTIFLSTYFWRKRGIVLMSSRSFDAEYMERTIKRFGFGTVKGSSTRGHTGATVEMIRLIRAGHPGGFTIDGPKGPRYVAKMGAVLVAQKSGQPILPFTIATHKCWELQKTWDHTRIPKPFSRARVVIGPPISVPAGRDENLLARKQEELQQSLDHLERQGKEWRAAVS